MKNKKKFAIRGKYKELRTSRFFSSISIDDGPDGCWNWTGKKDPHGYGYFCYMGEQKAHRSSWVLHFGEIPETTNGARTCVCHRCDNPNCCNPSHLFLSNQRGNLEDMRNKGRAKACLGEDKKTAKLTVKDVLWIYSRRDSGQTVRLVAQQFGVGPSAVQAIWSGRKWRSVTNHQRQ